MPKKIDPQLRARRVRLVRGHQQEYPLTAAVTAVHEAIHALGAKHLLTKPH